MTRVFLVTLVVCMPLVCSGASCETLTYLDLVNRLTDLEALSVLPQQGERCAQWSSYDRESVYDEKTGKYVKWEANADGGWVIREEGDSSVLAEMTGPGCIWRIWTAQAQDGHVKIYLDGSDAPAVDLPFTQYFDRTQSPFVYRALVHRTASGLNCYVPIPYQKSCKVVAEKGWGKYYHFTYSTFPEGTVVPTFKRDLSADERFALSKANLILTKGLGTDPAGMRPAKCDARTDHEIKPGMSQTILSVKGQLAVTAIRVKIDPADLQNAPDLLRELVLEIRWDGEEQPSVWCPLGDFFGTAPGVNHYKSLPLGMTEDGFYSYWYMPFNSADLRIVNDGTHSPRVKTEVLCSEITRNPATLGRFHAKWHRDAFLPTESERWIDWPMLKTQGRGRFCGVALFVYNPKGGWWGEGDEKFFVDGEKFPSTFGTGSEDYFGYAWCDPQLFTNAYHNQTLNQNKNAGNVSVNRWHIADNVPFQTSFEADIEKYFLNDRPTLFAAASYWYQAPGEIDPYKSLTISDRCGYFEYVQNVEPASKKSN